MRVQLAEVAHGLNLTTCSFLSEGTGLRVWPQVLPLRLAGLVPYYDHASQSERHLRSGIPLLHSAAISLACGP